MIFPVVTHRCESWTIKKAECWRIDAFELWCWRRLLTVLWTAKRSYQLSLKEVNPEYSLGRLMLKLKLQYFAGKYTLMGRADSLEKTLMMGKIEDRRKRGSPRIRWLDGQEFEQSLGHSKGQGSLVCCSPWGHKVSEQLSNWTTIAMESMTSLRRRTAKWSVVFCTQTSYPTPENCVLFEERKTHAAITCGDWALSYGFHETMHPIAYLSWVLMALQVAMVGVHSSDSSPDRHGISWMKQDQRAQTRCMR